MSEQPQGPGWWFASDGKWYPPQPPPVSELSGGAKRSGARTLVAVLACLALPVVAIGAVMVLGEPSSRTTTAGTRPTSGSSTTDAAPDGKPNTSFPGETTTTTEVETTTTAEPPPPVELAGTGDNIVDVTLPVSGEPAVARIVGSGSGNFAVWSLSSTGDRNDLLVNTIGAYQGVVPIDFRRGTTAAFEINADGPWSITVLPIESIERTEGEMYGTGDMVFAFLGDANRAAISYEGVSNFAVTLCAAEASRCDLLVNEIGAYSGTVRYSAGIVVLTASGPWSIIPV